ncbi:MAG: DUF4959 domain-containing protein [Bacteroidales bacterium]|nr:DUF4959 domain-containing protein [Bacteroidales bacterium]
MKKLLYSLLALSLFLFTSCGEAGRIDQLDPNLPAPLPVEVLNVTNIAGGAIIKVKIPEDENLIGVVAKYVHNGKECDVKISRYIDTLTIKGFGDTEEHQVDVCSFNVNEALSTPVTITIKPNEPAVRTVKMTYWEAFGGIKVSIENNVDNEPLTIGVLIDTEVSEFGTVDKDKMRWEEAGALYTSATNIGLSRRGLDAVPTIFGVYIKDKWDNRSDTIVKLLTPYEETKLERRYFRDAMIADDNCFGENSNYPVSNLWDGVITGTSILATKGVRPGWFTIDLGVTAKISRVGLAARQNYMLWSGGHPRIIEFWGNTKPEVGHWDQTSYSFGGDWVLLGGPYQQPKPSGYLPTGEVGTITSEDNEYINSKTEYEFDSAVYPHAHDAIRYLRVKINDTFATWGTDAANMAVQFSEIIPYGLVVEE